MEDYKKALNYALYILKRRDYTQKEVEEKLKRRGQFGEDVIRKVIVFLKERNFINDRRYAENYVFFRLKKGYGKVKIKRELLDKGVSEDLANRVLTEAHENIEDIFLKKFRLLEGKERIRRRLFSFLYRRGFDKDMIIDLLNKYEVKDDG